MKKIVFIVLVALIITAAGCAEKKDEKITEITIKGQSYVFSEDIWETLKVPTGSWTKINHILNDSEIQVVFDGTTTDNSYFAVVGYNIAFKLSRFRAWELREINFTTATLDNAIFDKPTVYMKGPNTGANETSVTIDNQTVIVQGTDFKNLTMAGDRLVLVVFEINDIGQI